jgi:hypothetical protein
MAGPHVAGVVALMRQANPNADVTTIKNVLMNTARDLGAGGEDNSYGWGVIDAYAAVQAVMQPDVEPPTVSVTAPNGGEILNIGSVFTVTWNAIDNVGVTQTSLNYSTDNGLSYTLIDSLVGNPGAYDWTVPDTPSNQCLVEVNAYDSAENAGSDVSDNIFTIEPASGSYVWVQSIDLTIETRGPNTNAKATVLVLDQDNNPVYRAEVHSHWEGLTTDSDIFTTKRSGRGSAKSDKLRNPVGWWHFTVDDVIQDGSIFRSDLGVTADSIYVQ